MRKGSKTRLNITSHSDEPFLDRAQAGRLLASQLNNLKGKNAVVLGIPRGGILVAKELARELEADLDIVLSRKLGVPGEPELAMGALSEDGRVFLNEEIVRMLGVTESDIEEEKLRQIGEIRRRNEFIRRVLPKTSLKERIVIVTDDGVATGATMQAALWAVRQEQPLRLIAAIPVASQEALGRLSEAADEILCLRQPPYSIQRS